VTSLAVYDGKLYGGGSSGYVYRYDGGTTWTDVGQLGSNSNVISLAVYDGKLYGGTEISGHVYSIGSGVAAYSNTALETGNYAHIAGTYDGTTAKIYVNGEKTEKTGSITIATKTFNLFIGGSLGSSKSGFSNSGEDYFKGVIDSVRISNTVRSPEWIATEYANQNDPASFYTIGQEEEI
ncbi:MAG: LamG domain-containing protein, partial [Candidatus Pacebacteria bacterium]|nr:LamG domain-containing protein [Candidatus Paceibacterota bacterium]